jgi:hypothetical protein
MDVCDALLGINVGVDVAVCVGMELTLEIRRGGRICRPVLPRHRREGKGQDCR